MTRLKILRLTPLLFAPLAAFATPAPPNVIVIITDQQQAGMLSCAGNRWVKTPAGLDGVRPKNVNGDLADALLKGA